MNLNLDNDITEVKNSLYQTKQEIYKQYKYQYFIVTNMKFTEPGAPYGWLGGFVKYYSKNYNKMNDLMMEVENILEFGESALSYGGDDIGTLGAMLV